MEGIKHKQNNNQNEIDFTEILELPKSARKMVYDYFHLPLGGKKIKCPYYRNTKKVKMGLRVMVGKGNPEEIVHEVKVWAKLKGVNLNKMTEKEIRDFMIKLGIGIDCSGFASHIMNAFLKDYGLKPLQKILFFKEAGIMHIFRRWLRPIENIPANDMTSTLNCNWVGNLNDVMPGDFIRVREKRAFAYHVAIIEKVYKIKKRVVKFDYIHSHSKYGDENGVRRGTIIILDPTKRLDEQEWHDSYQGRNYIKEDFVSNLNENFVKRLRVLDDIYKKHIN